MSQYTSVILGERYPLDARIATGGMGEVWRGTDLVLDRPVAVKILRLEYADDAVFWERFRAEAHNMAVCSRLRHPGIAQVHDFGQTQVGLATVPYIVMELVPGDPLSALIEREGPLDVDRALDIVAQAAEALHAAHQAGVVHRDVKPANLLVTRLGAVKVTDFGIARAADALPLTRTGTVMGTAHYLAPELARSTGGASPLSDVYALGVVLYECLAGQRPFPGDNPVAVALAHLQEEPPALPAWIPEPVRRLVGHAMAKDPRDRPATAAELARQAVALRITGDLAEPIRLAESAGVGNAAAAAAGAGSGMAGLGVAGAGAGASLGVAAGPDDTDTDQGSTDHHHAASAARPHRRSRPAGHRHARPAPPAARERQPRGGARPSPGLLMMAAGALLLLAAAAWLFLGSDTRTATVPDVTGLREAQARGELTALGFPLEIRREVNQTVPPGVVLKQRPVPGTDSSIRSPVLLVVSAGAPMVRLNADDWQGRPYDEVASALRRYGLEVTRRVVSGPGPAGTVADVSPDGLVRVGDAVTVSVTE